MRKLQRDSPGPRSAWRGAQSLVDRGSCRGQTFIIPQAQRDKLLPQDIHGERGPTGMQDHDPFGDVSTTGYREGKILFVPLAKAPWLPADRCIKCGHPACRELTRKISLRHPGWMLLELLGPLAVFLGAVALEKEEIEVGIGLCSKHLWVRRAMLLAAWLLFAAAIGAGIYYRIDPPVAETDLLIVLGLLVMSLVMACATSYYPVSIGRHGKYLVKIKGAGDAWLRQFRDG